MKKIVSFFGKDNEIYRDLNRRAEQYAASKGLGYAWALQQPYDREEVVRQLQQADAGIIDVEPYGEEIFAQVEGSAKLLVRFGVGYDKVDLAAATRHNIAVARTTAANAMGVAEMALTLILACRRQLSRNAAVLAAGDWSKMSVTDETVGATVGVVGMGAIGRKLTAMLRGIGCTVIAYDVYRDPEVTRELGVRYVELDELFAGADAVSIHCAYSAETHHLVDARRLALMKPSAVLVNTARGGIVDEEALYDALRAGQIRAAGLDVFGVEPLPLPSKLLELDNLLLTPHVSSQTVDSLWRIYAMAIDIAADFFAGRGSPHILNPEYRQQ